MDWSVILSPKRPSGERDPGESPRTPFQRDYDRVIYSRAFRRLADKTQVFPMPVDDHVHSRLTHSLEVASVGRSLGTLAASQLRTAGTLTAGVEPRDIGDCVAAACLAHDLGNPPFGHAGEEAIREFFRENEASKWFSDLQPGQALDFLNFDGNAHALRLATHGIGQYSVSGLDLTYATIGALVKYPCTSAAAVRSKGGRKSLSKHGINQTELPGWNLIADGLGLRKGATDAPSWHRHPLAFIAEAADDIAYQIIDLEDGLRIAIVPPDTFHELLRPLCENQPRSPLNASPPTAFGELMDYAGRARAVALNRLIFELAEAFVLHLADLSVGSFDQALATTIASTPQIDAIRAVNETLCYAQPDVLKLELAGAVAIKGILSALTKAVIEPDGTRSKTLRRLLPMLNRPGLDYGTLTSIVEYVAGMTDTFTIHFHREISGIRLPAGRE